jgi:uncharacterized protein YqhQ
MDKPEKELIVGGQAVIEGVMMRTPSAYAIAVRKPDGSIIHTAAKMPKWSDTYPALKLPIIRGGATLIQSMALGIKALNYSAENAFDEAEEEVVVANAATANGANLSVPVSVPKKKGKKGQTASAASSMFIAIAFNILLFIVMPLLLTNALYIQLGWATAPAAEAQAVNAAPEAAPVESSKPAQIWNKVKTYLHPVKPTPLFNLIDGLIRMVFFITMIFSFSYIRDIRRVFEYHGAEHKTVFAWEAGLPLTVENARIQPRQHPRCGTSFLMVVMIVAIVLFSVIRFDSLVLNLLVRVVLMPLVAGLSYEIIRLSANKESSVIFRLMTLPGVWLQNITTQEPDDQQLEVAIHALKESLKFEPNVQVA